jgi:protein involved in polysaccharide export with SLBB domain
VNIGIETMRRHLVILAMLLATPAAAQYSATPPSGYPSSQGYPQSAPYPPGSPYSSPQSYPPGQVPPQTPGTMAPAPMPPASQLPPSAPIFPQPPASQPTQPRSPAPGAPAQAAPKPPVPPGGRPVFDYSVNLTTDVFGANLFTGAFAASAGSIFNPDHVITIGDQLQVRLWGAFNFDSLLTVDAQGNIFLPQVGPVSVGGIPNRDLQKRLEEALRRTFKSNVHSYISLAAAQPVRVFVTGFVYRPGMYEGTSTDSVLRYLDQAGGIDTERGSFLDVKVMRGSTVRGQFNLYDFLLGGRLPGVQLGDGDVILVEPRQSMFKVQGLAENAKRFEFTGPAIATSQLVALARPLPTATHVRVSRMSGVVRNTEYYSLADATSVKLDNGDEVEFTGDKRPGTISVRVEGEHLSPQEYVLPYGAKLGELIKLIQFTPNADADHLQLFRLTVKERQRQLLQASLKTLETAVLTARSGTSEEARLRADEAQLMLQWVERARNLEPLGQVVIAQNHNRSDLLLENGDIIRVPVKNGLVLVHGEVLFPNAVAFDDRYDIQDYIKRAGGYTQNADTSRIVIAHRDGSFDESGSRGSIRAGDDILVLPKIDNKPRQFWRDIVQIIFQVALAAKVVLNN